MSANPSVDNDNSPVTRTSQSEVLNRYIDIRATSMALGAALSAEDACVQSMPDCSPAKWHLAHTTWFFETFVLSATGFPYETFHPQFKVLFNSYYNSVGEQFPRPTRGLLTRPTLDEVRSYRGHVDSQMQTLLNHDINEKLLSVVEVGLHHEQQHQELLLMDIKHLFSLNPLKPAFRVQTDEQKMIHHSDEKLEWLDYEQGVFQIGAESDNFCFDNETPRHRTYLEKYSLADRLIKNAEYLEFVNDGGYDTPNLWLSDGWSTIQEHRWRAPLYWRNNGDSWREFTLHGEQELDPHAPVVHVSFYEADAFARWSGARLPTEAEWEHASLASRNIGCSMPNSSNSTDNDNGSSNARLETRTLHPNIHGLDEPSPMHAGLFDTVWQWTASAYLPYPGYIAPPGAIGEYNGKFMSNQMVLKGSCCVTPPGHSRSTYRNFFYPHCRWQFAGIRLAK